ncbi:MAG: hypothetical protein Q4F64_10025 [Corynebacterium casei]|nr:hypothetical protein [Corynebacterium casei]
MRKLTTALVSAATAAALALSIAPTAVAQSAFSLSSSGSKPAPSDPKNPTPTPKPGNSTEAKLRAYENGLATLYTKAGAVRTEALDSAAKAGLEKAIEGNVPWYTDPETHFAAYQTAGDEYGMLYMRSPLSALEAFSDNFDDEIEAMLLEIDEIEGEFGLAIGSDDQYYYIVFAGNATTVGYEE